ncbi:hypothetical protein G4Y79_17240 [Phototrophicus methaneseepsis]|uniref:Endonuclease/exonuclease/phosphatase domain-containing protein n=1 Tax=Phototrophicus methaneseepsis TaxID=2710758 RepID=A0A7S8E6T7_9CHLR|nr:endonuclease/exonuclease/phosphatase family protein [Phototrophicus methaneseepsis]QPC81430.1 hypothetical protein G4Y79_17240 [Phototrophicus methaneseepsis]
MLKRMRNITNFFPSIEVGLAGLLFISALRFIIGELYSRTASASLITQLTASGFTVDPTLAGFSNPSAVSGDIAWLGLVIALPLLTLFVGRIRVLFVPAALMLAIGRLLMGGDGMVISHLLAAEIAVSGGLLYLGLLIRNRATLVPHFFILGFVGDQLLRAWGNTLDPTWSLESAVRFFITPSTLIEIPVLPVLAILLFSFSFINILRARNGAPVVQGDIDPEHGELTFWGGIGLGAMLFLQLALLATPNAIASRTDADYTTFVPAVLAATALPLIPWVRYRARNLIAPFDTSTRGWIWLVGMILLIVIGTRLPHLRLAGLSFPIGATALVIAQLGVSLLWWWLVRPKAPRGPNLSGVWLVMSTIIFGLFVVCDLFTYEYAFVRPLAAPFAQFNDIVLPILQGFRGLGLGVLVLAILFALLPMIQSSPRIPWRNGPTMHTLGGFIFVIIVSAAGAFLARPPAIVPVVNVSDLRIGTYNIHGGYSEFYAFSIEAQAATIAGSGADVMLLQEVERGRLTSYGVDQALWLARRLKMDTRFYATNEGLQGLAVLSKVPIVFDDGVLLPSIDQQTGLQRVQIQDQPGGAITIYNTSLGLLVEDGNLEDQENNQTTQLRAILDTIAFHIQNDYDGQLGRAVLGGTFHNIPDSPLLQDLARTGFVDPFAGSNLELSATIRRVGIPPTRWDYIWLWSQTLRSTGTVVMSDSQASDHRLAVVGVQIRRDQ